jgi:DNA-binding CsgD family transcriptional regulator
VESADAVDGADIEYYSAIIRRGSPGTRGGNMNPYSVLTLCGAIFYVQIGLLVFRIRRDRIHSIFALLALCMALYAVYQTVIYSSSSRDLVDLAVLMFRIFGCDCAAICLLSLFALELSAKDWKPIARRWAEAAVALGGLFFYVQNLIKMNLIRDYRFQDGMWFEVITPLTASGAAYLVFLYANFLFCLLLLLRWFLRAPSVLERSQARLLLSGALATMTVHGIINYVLPFATDRVVVPRITTICFIPYMVAIWYAIRKLQFLSGIPKSVERNPSWRLLTRREREIVTYLRRGESFKRIGEILFISEGTVRKHVENMRGKLDVRNRVELIYKVFAEDSEASPGDAES